MKTFLFRTAFLIAFSLFLISPLQAEIFTVTSSQCDGPGSIVAAIDQANLMAGDDIIEFDPNLQVSGINTGACSLSLSLDPSTFYLGQITDNLTINGNGAKLLGAPKWVTTDGAINPVGLCPRNVDLIGSSIISEAPGFLRVESGVEVTINDLAAQDLSAFINLREGSTVELNNVEVTKINDFFSDCARSAIEAPVGDANLSITNSYFEQIRNTANTTGSSNSLIFRGSNIVSGTGVLKVKGTHFQDAASAIQWSGDADIESSQFIFSGWVNAYDSGTMNIVNSAFQGRSNPDGDSDSIRASGGAIVNIVASSLNLPYLGCNNCRSGPGAIVAVSGGKINMIESALGVGLTTLNYPNLRTETLGTISADEYTWIQPVTPQTAADLKIITGQPDLKTNPPGLPNIFVGNTFPAAITPLLGTMMTPGVLIDAISDADPGEANELVSLIDGMTIVEDALGNPRVDANGRRNIGAVQLTLSPHLVVAGIGDGTVDLSWSRPLDPPSGAITGYGLSYREAGTVPWSRIDVGQPDTLTQQVAALTNGTDYEFNVVAVNAVGDGPTSNQVSATPLGPIGAPVVTAQPELNQMALTWTKPSDGGHELQSYTVYYRLVGETDWTYAQTVLGPDNLMTTIAGLMGGVAYEFGVQAVATDGTNSPLGTVVASPLASEARFHVTKSFSDQSTDNVTVTLSCNTGLLLTQMKDIAGGDPVGVNFVVTHLDGSVDCEVSESGGPPGYTAVFNGGTGCSWSGVVASQNSCHITNVAQDATFTVKVEWIITSQGGIDVETNLPVTVTCDSEITSASAGAIANDKRSVTALIDDGESLYLTVDTQSGSATCEASQKLLSGSGVESDNNCGPTTLPAGSDESCSIVNTVFFEGIPTLNQSGMVILALLMLGAGLIGFRRIS